MLINQTYLVPDVLEVWFEVFLCTVQESLRLEVGSTEGEQVHGGQPGLLARGNEHNDWQFGGVLADGVVHWLHHGNEARGSVSDVEPLGIWEGK